MSAEGTCALITPAQCGSSLAMSLIEKRGYAVGPPGAVDDRHPLGHYDWDHKFLEPQISGDWEGYKAAVESVDAPFAFKLISGIIHWGIDALLILPRPIHVIWLDRDWRSAILYHVGVDHDDWLWQLMRAAVRLMPKLPENGITYEFWSKEAICDGREESDHPTYKVPPI